MLDHVTVNIDTLTYPLRIHLNVSNPTNIQCFPCRLLLLYPKKLYLYHVAITQDKTKIRKQNNGINTFMYSYLRPLPIAIVKVLNSIFCNLCFVPQNNEFLQFKVFAAVSVSTGCLSFGICMAYTSSAIPSMMENSSAIKISSNEASWMSKC